jgi:hypothetical protein
MIADEEQRTFLKQEDDFTNQINFGRKRKKNPM